MADAEELTAGGGPSLVVRQLVLSRTCSGLSELHGGTGAFIGVRRLSLLGIIVEGTAYFDKVIQCAY